MMNSLRNTSKYLRIINLKTALQATKECKPNKLNQVQAEKCATTLLSSHISMSPRSIGVEIIDKINISRIQQEPIKYVPIINPRSILPLVEEWRNEEVGLPSVKQEEIQAARLIVIRKKKMRKHKRRKLWKRMRHRWARVKQRRRLVKEKTFQNELLSMMKAANEFSAEQYVQGKLDKANHTPLPTRWRHKRLPEFIIRQLLGIDKKINYKHTDKYKA